MSIAVFFVFIFLWKSSICDSEGNDVPVCLAPTIINATTEGGCPPSSVLDAGRNSQLEAVRLAIRDTILPALCPDCPPCVCGGQGEWVSIARLNFSDPTVDCPANWNLVTSPERGCGRFTTAAVSCDSAFVPSGGCSYSRVCGQVIGARNGLPDAFHRSTTGDRGVDGVYLDGVSLTHGAAGSRQHIWSFPAATNVGDESTVSLPSFACPCARRNADWPFEVPAFVGDNYFCGTVTPFWSNEGCGPTNDCCELNNPPYFCTSLPEATTDDLELRLCFDQGSFDEDIIITLIDLYIM